MGTKERIFSPLPYDVSLSEDLVQDNFYRRLEQTLDLSFVRDLVRVWASCWSQPWNVLSGLA